LTILILELVAALLNSWHVFSILTARTNFSYILVLGGLVYHQISTTVGPGKTLRKIEMILESPFTSLFSYSINFLTLVYQQFIKWHFDDTIFGYIRWRGVLLMSFLWSAFISKWLKSNVISHANNIFL